MSGGPMDGSLHDQANGVRSPLWKPDFEYVENIDYYNTTRAEHQLLVDQGAIYKHDRQADLVLDMFRAGQHEPSYGYQVNMYRHCLQSATLLHRAGFDEETVVVGLLHDIGFNLTPQRHGPMAAELLGPWVSEANAWMLEHHQVFATFEAIDEPPVDPDARARERWRGHPHYEWTLLFVTQFDQSAMDPNHDNAPLEFFEPMVRRVLAKPSRVLPIPE
jgi:predicted HD phosphohydrolase